MTCSLPVVNILCVGIPPRVFHSGEMTDQVPLCGVPELELRCESNITKMNINQVAYRVWDINPERGTLSIAREDNMVGLTCSPRFRNSTFNPKVFEYVESYKNLTFSYGCKDAPPAGRIPFTCKIYEIGHQTGICWEELLKKSIRGKIEGRIGRRVWNCIGSKGACGIDQATCYCPSKVDQLVTLQLEVCTSTSPRISL
uniref:Wall-associated receptor kinase galacturonan-binding domain-containing protein n=1 Tax=Populus alba TaxID=43335 RepID=A0A4U5PTF9_POPAL|nr:hypothetical protein D5086_0000182780 [Populus alba]